MKWIKELELITEEVERLFGSLSPEQLNWKPDPGTWSIGENIAHLIVVNASYFPMLEALKEGTYHPPFIAKIGFVVRFLGRTILETVQPNSQKKMKTFPIWEPGTSSLVSPILQQFKAHQKALCQQLEGMTALLDKGVVISSPANKYIVYPLETAFDIMVTHEQRHLKQAKEVLKTLHSGNN